MEFKYQTIQYALPFQPGDVQALRSIEYKNQRVVKFTAQEPYVLSAASTNNIRGGEFSGGAYIAGNSPGIVTMNGLPAQMEVEIRSRATRKLVDVQISKPDGSYSFNTLNPNFEYDVIARDSTRTYNDIIIPAVVPWRYKPALIPDIDRITTDRNFDIRRVIQGGEPPYKIIEQNLVNASFTLTGSAVNIKHTNVNNKTAKVDAKISDVEGNIVNISMELVDSFYGKLKNLSPYILLRLNEFSDGRSFANTGSTDTNATLNSTYWEFVGEFYTTGDKALRLHSNWYEAVQAPASIFPTSYDEFTVALLYMNETTNNPSYFKLIAGQSDAYDQTWQFRSTTGTPYLQLVKILNGGVVESVTSNIVLEALKPYVIILTVKKDGSVIIQANDKVYTQNGGLTGNYGSAIAPLSIGSYANGRYPGQYNHRFSNFAFFNRVLTENEKTDLLNIQNLF